MNAIVEIQPKLSKLIPLLASDQSGEVVSAAAAIGRTLQSVGCDFHDLVKAIGAKPSGGFSGKPPPDEDWSKVGYPAMAEFCCEHREDLKPHEAGFVRDMKVRMFFDSTFCPSPKQRKWLKALYTKLRLMHS